MRSYFRTHIEVVKDDAADIHFAIVELFEGNARIWVESTESVMTDWLAHREGEALAKKLLSAARRAA